MIVVNLYLGPDLAYSGLLQNACRRLKRKSSYILESSVIPRNRRFIPFINADLEKTTREDRPQFKEYRVEIIHR